LFPWATDVVRVLAPNLFLDATFNMTIYQYKVAVIECVWVGDLRGMWVGVEGVFWSRGKWVGVEAVWVEGHVC